MSRHCAQGHVIDGQNDLMGGCRICSVARALAHRNGITAERAVAIILLDRPRLRAYAPEATS